LAGPTESIATDGIVQVGETWTYVGSYVVQQSDIDTNGGGDGTIGNTATVSSDQLPDLSDSASVSLRLPVIIDNGDDGFEVVSGPWNEARCYGWYEQDAHYLCDTTGGSSVVQWQFSDLTPGNTYQVATTWAAGATRTVDAPYTVTGGGAPITIDVNQQIAPQDYPGAFQDGDGWWVELVAAYVVTGDTLTVQLSDDHSGGCIAGDAVRILEVIPSPAPALASFWDSADWLNTSFDEESGTSSAEVLSDWGASVEPALLGQSEPLRPDSASPLELVSQSHEPPTDDEPLAAIDAALADGEDWLAVRL
jgi:hypothetical protein